MSTTINRIEISKYMDQEDMDAIVIERIKETLGEDATYRVMVWPQSFDREEGMGFYRKSPKNKGWALEEALDKFWDNVESSACAELHVCACNNPAFPSGRAICIGGQDYDVKKAEWLCLEELGFDSN